MKYATNSLKISAALVPLRVWVCCHTKDIASKKIAWSSLFVNFVSSPECGNESKWWLRIWRQLPNSWTFIVNDFLMTLFIYSFWKSRISWGSNKAIQTYQAVRSISFVQSFCKSVVTMSHSAKAFILKHLAK